MGLAWKHRLSGYVLLTPEDGIDLICENSSTYSPNSTYEANLNQLFLNLSSTNATQNNGFYRSEVGRGSPDAVYGLFLCRGDVNADICEDCVKNATTDMLQLCANRKEAIIWYNECMLRYSNQSIVSSVQQYAKVSFYNTQNITNEPDRFEQLLADTLNEIATEASTNLTGKKFATKAVNFTAFQRLYTLAQCTPDLSISDCNSCLQDLISRLPSCCANSQGALILFTSCNIRYEVYPFYNSTSAPAPNTRPLAPPPPSNSSINEGNGGISTKVIIAIVVPVVVSLVLFFIGICLFIRRKKYYDAVNEEHEEENEISIVESLQYDLNTIQLATNNFSLDNKIGEGGFGAVYKGTFPNGQEIAVKRLSKSSGQGAKEFKNEVVLVAKLQHRNLARLLGFCLEGEEKILVYEFVPNKSLDYFLFDPEKRQMLDWSKRYKIIGGIARGMSQGNTSRIVGTYGYMSPEYAMHGKFSMKSDVFSFGVLVLEILSGKKNSNFDQSDGDEVLITYAWKLWRDGRPLDLIDPTLKDSFNKNEMIRCMQIGLLCVQEDVDERPNMTSVILTLNSYSATLVVPREPAFFFGSSIRSIPMGPESDKSTSTSIALSTNEASISELYPR
ncbi:unnamed protein product [Fraxinus pennsylvanica]|uniref:Cysteine-rich receptor-like protein kinase n=1 Tax=Fraxinus pennsylvanica TaxID=56036 RepID=A0AAD2E161_9LAMI|nr:unnamed protein product [Fraxinus pennsylvanica]